MPADGKFELTMDWIREIILTDAPAARELAMCGSILLLESVWYGNLRSARIIKSDTDWIDEFIATAICMWV